MSKMNSNLTQSRLREVLRYCWATGLFSWVAPQSNRVRVGDIAGYIDKSTGYVRITIDGGIYYAHRLAMLYIHGETPDDVDHKDRNRAHNALDNLRCMTRSGNLQNRSITDGRGSSKFLGVSRRGDTGKWAARIRHKGRYLSLGSFDEELDAAAAYERAKEELHPGYLPRAAERASER